MQPGGSGVKSVRGSLLPCRVPVLISCEIVALACVVLKGPPPPRLSHPTEVSTPPAPFVLVAANPGLASPCYVFHPGRFVRPQKTIPFLSLAATPWWGLWLATPPIGFLTSLWCPYGYSCASGILCSRLQFIHVHWPCHLGDGFSYVSALGADPFDFFLNSRSGAGRLWLGSRPYS